MSGALRPAIAALAAVGLAIAGYLTYVHVAGLKPLCVAGSGGCETVQASEQSEVAGVPVAVLGLLGYAGLLVTAWPRTEAARVLGALLGLVGFGFSAYLTYAELFVIGTICQWCVASAVVMTMLAGLTVARLLQGDAPSAGLSRRWPTSSAAAARTRAR